MTHSVSAYLGGKALDPLQRVSANWETGTLTQGPLQRLNCPVIVHASLLEKGSLADGST